MFLDRFPDPTHCAAAPPGEVIELWAGMGYNRRALNLHRAATVVRSDHGGEIPSTLRELQALPGVGPYTARAVLVFAFEQPEAVVDTNVGRILARVVGGRLDSRQVQMLADRALGDHDPWTWNQAILDVGAKFCRPRSYACDFCPLSGACSWFRSGNSEPDPASASAAVSGRQSTFDGSDRQGRGRLVDALRSGSVDLTDVGTAMGWEDDPGRARRVLQGLLDDGLVTIDGDTVRLPD